MRRRGPRSGTLSTMGGASADNGRPSSPLNAGTGVSGGVGVGVGVFVIWRQILEREMLIERVRVRMYVFFVITKQG